MVYCWKCGSQVGEQTALCPKCGATLRGTMGVQSPTGFELLRDDKSVQNHWARRVVAILIDAAIVVIVLAVIAAVSQSPSSLGWDSRPRPCRHFLLGGRDGGQPGSHGLLSFSSSTPSSPKDCMAEPSARRS